MAPEYLRRPRRGPNGGWARAIIWLSVILVAALGYWWYTREQAQQRPGTMPEPPPTQVEPEVAPPRHPVPEPEPRPEVSKEKAPAEPPASLPPLAESDGAMLAALGGIFPDGVLDAWLVHERVIERTVLYIHSLDGEAIPQRFRPVRHLPGLPAVLESDDGLRWHPANAARYEFLVAIMEVTDVEAVAEVYFRHYPLFQQAFTDLGTGGDYFNDRLVEVIDHLLDAPRVAADFPVERPDVLYVYADPDLEAQSWGRKMLMRMGPDNATAVKGWLRALRARVATRDPDGQ